jgi:deferrochelatase/peroxidase EfeB
MPVNLQDGPIDPTKPKYQTMLRNLQGNILQPHGREYADHIFLQFRAGVTPASVRDWLRAFTECYVTSAEKQYREARIFKECGTPGGVFGNLFLSATGYEALEYEKERIRKAFPVDQASTPSALDFSAGMAHHANLLRDPDPESWECAYQDQKIDAMILLAHDNEEHLSNHTRIVKEYIENVAKVANVLTIEHGHRLYNVDKHSVDPFGYRDGLSNPVFLRSGGGHALPANRPVWNPDASLDLVLLCDPFAETSNGRTAPDCFGSYLVFRKLEQNIQGFHKRIQKLKEELGYELELAEARVVGRYRNGLPVVLPDSAGTNQPLTNDFNYDQDPHGLRCPVHAHIRRLNPRGDTNRSEADFVEERSHRIARRSQPYGKLPDTYLSSASLRDYPINELPEDNVGILFMCFQRSLTNQFGYLQALWANSTVRSGGSQQTIGIDPIIGSPRRGRSCPIQPMWPVEQGKPPYKPFDFHGFVKLKGGEFLFAPSLHFLRNLENSTEKL